MSANILFITQSKQTIDELQKIIREEGDHYKLFFAQTSHTALNIISDNVITAVTIDLSFAKFDSPGLLSILQYDFPRIFRLCIFSPKERQKYIGLSKYFHKTIKFPLIPKEVLKTISELANLSNDQLDPVLIEEINGLGTIPVLPDIYLRLEKEISSSNLSMNRIAEIIQTDPLMTARILHIAHSSFYNIPSGVTNLLQALNYLGMKIIKSLVLYVKIFSLNDVSNETQTLLKEVKAHSINVAKLCKAIMEKETQDKSMIEMAYITGLLHDVGKILLLQFYEKQKSAEYFENIHTLTSNKIEEKLYGVSHVKVGIYILRLWGFHDDLIQAIATHHDSNILDSKALSLKEILYISNIFSYQIAEPTANISYTYGREKFDQWDHLFNEDIRPSLDLPI